MTHPALFLVFALAALAEIGGCFAFWMWLRLGKSSFWIAPGVVLLIAFAVLLTRADAAFAGRAYAAYGGVYVAASFVKELPDSDAWDEIITHKSIHGVERGDDDQNE